MVEIDSHILTGRPLDLPTRGQNCLTFPYEEVCVEYDEKKGAPSSTWTFTE